MKNGKYERLAGVLNFIHILVTLISIISMVVIFFPGKFQFYSAIWLFSLWMVEQIFKGCPLTVEEYNLRIKAGEKISRKKFIPWCFKRYLRLDIPDWLAEIWLALYFVLSVVVLSRFT